MNQFNELELDPIDKIMVERYAEASGMDPNTLALLFMDDDE